MIADNGAQPLVSICLLTYNHEDYIRQCLDSILAQQVNFKYEVVVGDDCSQDSTQDILREYQEKNPDIFQMYLRDHNLGATRNLYDILNKCKGKYLAGIEGDDYWIDENKLQIQFDFLENHPEYIGCSHDVKMIDELGQERPMGRKYFATCHWKYYKEVYTYNDFVKFEKPGQASTWFYRNIFINPKYDYSIIQTADPLIADTTVMLLVSTLGDWYYMIGKKMTCYRFITQPDKGSWASWSQSGNRTLNNFLYYFNLEKYAKDVLGVKLDFVKQKFQCFQSALNWYTKSKEFEEKKENKRILKTIWSMMNHKTLYTIKVIQNKIFAKIYLPTIKYAIENGELDTKDERLRKSTWREFKKISKNRTIVIFGGGASCKEFIMKYGKKYSVPIVIDNSISSHGKPIFVARNYKEMEAEIYDFAYVISPEEIELWNKDRFVILITSLIYQDEMAKQLKAIGFTDYFSFGIMESHKFRYKFIKKGTNKNGYDDMPLG